ncbi:MULTISPECIES: hypothetical protein [unclassified Streptomyces]|uniref:hypothetical protein n=1 Tax=unclassified Streptomyces TaxID=2593676 RepID=UPI00381041D6
MPTLSRGALEREGFEVIERRQPSLLAGGILITGEVDRATEFEHGMPPAHQAWTGTAGGTTPPSSTTMHSSSTCAAGDLSSSPGAATPEWSTSSGTPWKLTGVSEGGRPS